MKPFIPCSLSNPREDAALGLELVRELGELCRSMAYARAGMLRCRRTDSPTCLKHEDNWERMSARHADIRSYLRTLLEDYGGMRQAE